MNRQKFGEPWQRACGSREQDKMYIKVETSPVGKPIEHFIIDPPMEWDGDPPIRSPIFVPGGEEDLKHVVLGVGREYYPTVPDFVEEARKIGISKKVRRNFDFSKLTKGKSRMILMHPKAIPIFDFDTNIPCPNKPEEAHVCTHRLWSLSALHRSNDQHYILSETVDEVEIEIPCGRKYTVEKPLFPSMEGYREHYSEEYKPGHFLAVPITRLEYVNSDGKIPSDVKETAEESDMEVVVCDQ